jgi:hypothetical protein
LTKNMPHIIRTTHEPAAGGRTMQSSPPGRGWPEGPGEGRDRLFMAAIRGNGAVRWSLPILVFLLLTGCATGGGKNVTVEQRDVKPTQRTPEPAARPKIPPAISQPEAARPPPSTPFPTAKQSCKVKRDSVEWLHLSGGCKNGYAHGEGRARSVDGHRSYIGAFVDGAFSGHGDYDWGDGVHYTGEFLKGRRNGFGTLVYPDNKKYIGQFRDNAYHGEGTYIDTDGSKYAGGFQNGYYHGQGTYTWANGDTYAGQFKGNQMDGDGNYTRSNGDRYVGAFKNSEMSGEGTYTWPHGDAYTGRFENDKMSGKGTYTYPDASKYSGEFRDGKKHGTGVLITELGAIKQQWRDGQKVAEDRP